MTNDELVTRVSNPCQAPTVLNAPSQAQFLTFRRNQHGLQTRVTGSSFVIRHSHFVIQTLKVLSMPPLNTPQLEAIQRLLTDPLRQTVRAEMQAGHDRLASAIQQVTDQLTQHAAASIDAHRAQSARTDQLDRRLTALERFRAKVLLVYSFLTLLCTVAWSALKDWLPHPRR